MVRLAVLILSMAGLAGCATAPGSPEVTTNYGEYRDGSEHPAVLMLFQQADEAMQAGKPAMALTYLDQARRIEPRNPYVLYRQARAYAVADDNEKARQLLERARVFASSDDEMINYLLYELEFQL